MPFSWQRQNETLPRFDSKMIYNMIKKYTERQCLIIRNRIV